MNVDREIPERAWKRIADEELWMIEDLNQSYDADVVFKRLVRFSLSLWLVVLAVAAVALIGTSYYLNQQKECEWWSNLCLNLSMGVIASLLILLYTTRRERILAGYQVVIDLLQERIAQLTRVRHDKMTNPLFAFKTCGYEDGCGWLYGHLNFTYTLKGFFSYLDKYLSPVFPYFPWKKIREQLAREFASHEKLISDFITDWDRTQTEKPEQARTCCCTNYRLERKYFSAFEHLLNMLRIEVGRVRFGTDRYEVKLKSGGTGGVINDQILSEMKANALSDFETDRPHVA